MAKSEKQKEKLLHILQILWDETDEENSISTQRLIALLEQRGVRAERKSIYSDIETLRSFGFDIVSGRGAGSGHALVGREFEVPELKLLVDAVQSSKFITQKKSLELIGKLERLCSVRQRSGLRRQIYVQDRVKTMNESIYYNVDAIHAALAGNRQIAFQYYEYNVRKEKIPRRNGQDYVVSPFALTWDDENYYLIAYDAGADALKHYRVDKMGSIRGLPEERLGMERFRDLNLAQYAKRVFGMFGGTGEQVRLQFRSHLAGVVIDRFGSDVMLVPGEDDTFTVTVEAAVSPQFLAWVFSFGQDVRVLSPARVAEQLRDMARAVAEQYG